MQVFCFWDGSYASNCYLVTDKTAEHAVVVDPSVPFEKVQAEYGALPKIEALLLTHAHFDHMLCLDQWRRMSGAPVYVMAEDSYALHDAGLSCYRLFLGEETVFAPAERLLADGDVISFGEETLRVLALPGHTPGSCAFVGDGGVLCGDTVFAGGGYGRFDLPGGSATALSQSLLRLWQLPGEYTLYPGHGRTATLSEERKFTRI